jgi:hypothetical protein
MQALSDEQQIDRVEKKVDRLEEKMEDGFAAIRSELRSEIGSVRSEIGSVRSEAREDFRLLLGVQLAMFMAMILGFAGILLQHHL